MVIKKNNGSATIEACIVVPLFMFLMLAVVYMHMMLSVDAHIHQSLSEAAIYGAQYCYLEERMLEGAGGSLTVSAGTLVNSVVINKQFREYLGEDNMVDRVVAGGKSGIIITVHEDSDNSKIFHAKASYMIRLPIPIIGNYGITRINEVKQKAFLGYSKEEAINDSNMYVYITPNESVYHLSRGCSHLNVKVREQSGHGSYPPCSFCGNKDNDTGKVYITENGDVYHNSSYCLGLKRTVIRVKRSSISGIGPCSRCGN